VCSCRKKNCAFFSSNYFNSISLGSFHFVAAKCAGKCFFVLENEGTERERGLMIIRTNTTIMITIRIVAAGQSP